VGNIRSHFSPEFVISCSLFPVKGTNMSVYEFFLPASLRGAFRFGVGAYCLFIVWATLRPSGTGEVIPHLDKVLHMLVYALLAASIALGWPKLSKFRIFWGCVFFGAAMEIAQGLIGSGRTVSLWDGMANSLGAALGVYTVVLTASLFTR